MGGQKRPSGTGVLTLHNACFYFQNARVSVSRNFLDSNKAERRVSKTEQGEKAAGKTSFFFFFLLCLSSVSTSSGGESRVYPLGLASPFIRWWLKATDRA